MIFSKLWRSITVDVDIRWLAGSTTNFYGKDSRFKTHSDPGAWQVVEKTMSREAC